MKKETHFGLVWSSVIVAVIIAAGFFFAFAAVGIGATFSENLGNKETKVNLTEKLDELGATDISVVGDAYISFKMGCISAQLLRTNDGGDSMLYVSSDNSCWIPAFIDQQDTAASFRYFDKNLNISLTDTQIRCLDYAAYTGEFFQKKSGEYHAVYDDIGIWLNGTEPPDYDYDK